MSKTAYHISLKGFVGGADFDRNYLDFVLAQNSEQSVFVLIDSPGDSLPTALSMPRRSVSFLKKRNNLCENLKEFSYLCENYMILVTTLIIDRLFAN